MLNIICSSEIEAKLFKNRLNILKQQEEKAKKYVEEAQRKAKKIEEINKIKEQQLQHVCASINNSIESRRC